MIPSPVSSSHFSTKPNMRGYLGGEAWGSRPPPRDAPHPAERLPSLHRDVGRSGVLMSRAPSLRLAGTTYSSTAAGRLSGASIENLRDHNLRDRNLAEERNIVTSTLSFQREFGPRAANSGLRTKNSVPRAGAPPEELGRARERRRPPAVLEALQVLALGRAVVPAARAVFEGACIPLPDFCRGIPAFQPHRKQGQGTRGFPTRDPQGNRCCSPQGRFARIELIHVLTSPGPRLRADTPFRRSRLQGQQTLSSAQTQVSTNKKSTSKEHRRITNQGSPPGKASAEIRRNHKPCRCF